ncbi:DUF1272 domain-containing protein, partial [Klebsiella quasipneumoniae]
MRKVSLLETGRVLFNKDDMPPDSREAFICSFECTFCQDCMTARL